MADDLRNSLAVSASGMRAQGVRLRVISENVANAKSTATKPDEDPYRRRVVTFQDELDRARGVRTVEVRRVSDDPSDFQLVFEPNHPAANADGYVRYPNVNAMLEAADMREAQRSYEANLNMMQTTRSMIQSTVDLLR